MKKMKIAHLHAHILITIILINTVILINGQQQQQQQQQESLQQVTPRQQQQRQTTEKILQTNKKCNYEDTVDLRNTEKLANGSYLYEHLIVIEPERTSIYDYEEFYNGKRISVTPHLRGCLCDKYRCMKFCCHPTNELILNNSRECGDRDLIEELSYDPYINITLNNGSITMVHVRNDFFTIQGVPCEYTYPIIPQEDDDDKWTLFENGTLLRHYDERLISKRDYCMQPYKLQNGEWVLNPRNCPTEKEQPLSSRINNIAMAVSIPFIILTILVYSFLPKLRNLHGKCLISYLLSLAIGYCILCTITLSTEVFATITCSLLGYMGYFFLMAAFFWLSIISYDLWQNFRFTTTKVLTQRKRFLVYCLYAWGCPLILTAVVIIAQNSNLNQALKPGIGDDQCWLKTHDWSAMLYFFGIHLIIILVNICMFIFTIIKIIQIQRELQHALNNEEQSSHLRKHKNNVTLFLRLFIIMGVSWLLDTLSYIMDHDPNQSNNIIFFITDFMNAIQGILIFILFVLKPKVWRLLKNGLQTSRRGRERGYSTTQSQRITLQNSLSQNKFNILIPKK